jgi:excisionase family DNA binding protein
MEPIMVSVPQAAKLLGLGRSTTWKLVRSGELPSVRVRNRVLLRRVELELWAAKLAMEQVA